jgi:hypothetical protein
MAFLFHGVVVAEWSWSGRWKQIESLQVGGKYFGGEMVLGQIVYAFARLSIVEIEGSSLITEPLIFVLFTHAPYFFF